ncbi:peptidoglycan-binding protein [Anabaena catenula]|uniref:HEAT repeat domain-containing protein n=1 Tax=Anabaena catenula FACHB-362 TaxID=2692877 RepID=A0ABR8IYN6_9NOST|nr:HEAT repeat domain-containing protein [Anabaena catenula]MBD2690690.1 HEAT repeat domain-containing protein [Anabaena catenula FACHB-362]
MRVKPQRSITNYQSVIPYSIFILTSCIGLGLYPSRAITATVESTPNPTTVLSPGVKGAEVQVIQVQLKALGYYSGSIDGDYSPSTQNALAQFQQAQGLKRADGVADWTTRQHLKSVLSGKIQCNTSAPITEEKNPNIQSQQENSIWWRLISFGVLGTLGVLFYLAQKLSESKLLIEGTDSEQLLLNPSSQKSPQFFLNPAPTVPSPRSTELLTSQQTTVISALSIADELMKDLHSNDATKRRKAIWHLGQQGDSRAIKPLVDLMLSADSRQHSLILSALAEIGIRTLKPMNRALAISIQDENPQVRQNAIRDLSRIYDMMSQMSQMLRHAMEDEDPEVQATAQYALNHMNRVRVLPNLDEHLEDSHPEPQP